MFATLAASMVPPLLHLQLALLVLALVVLLRRHLADVRALPRRVRILLLLVVAASAALRLGNVEAAAIVYSDEFEALLSARHMLLEHGLGYPLNLGMMAPAHRPGYPALVAVPLALGGASDRAAAVASAVLGTLAVPLTFALACLLFGDAWGALAAAALIGLHPDHLRYSVTGWSAAASHATSLLALVLVAYAARPGRSRAWSLAAALAAGLSTQVRAANTLLVPVGALWLWRGSGARPALLFAAVSLLPSALLLAAIPPGGAPSGLPCPWAEGACTELSLARVFSEPSSIGVRGALPGYLLHVFAGVARWGDGPREAAPDLVTGLLGTQRWGIDPLAVAASALALAGLAARPSRGHALVWGLMLSLIAANSLFASDPRLVLDAVCLVPVLAGAGAGALAQRLPGGGRAAAVIVVILLLRFHTQGAAPMLRLHRGEAEGEDARAVADLLFQHASVARLLGAAGVGGCAIVSPIPIATAFSTGDDGVDVRAVARDPALRARVGERARNGCVLYLETCSDWVRAEDEERVRSSFRLAPLGSLGPCRTWSGEERIVSLFRLRPLARGSAP